MYSFSTKVSLSALISLLFLKSASAQWASNVPVDSRSLDEIYESASKESGPLTVLWGGDARDQATSTVNAWQQRFPKIPLNLTVDLSKYHDGNVDRSFYQGSEGADVAVLQTLHDFPRWAIQNRLLYYKPANFSLIDSGEKDLNGAWLPLKELSFGPWTYDSTALNATDLPTSFAELLEPQWKGKLVLTYPNDDDAVSYLFSLIVSKYGFDWLNTLAQQQDVKWVRGTATPGFVVDPAQRSASDSSRVLSFTTFSGGTSPAVKTIPPATEPYMSWFQRSAIFASTPRPESARLWMAWTLSDEFQRPAALNGSGTPFAYLNEMSGVDPHASNVTQVDGFERFMNDRALAEWWRFQFELTIGPAVGPNPNTIYTQP